jgi:chromosome partitioning protein
MAKSVTSLKVVDPEGELTPQTGPLAAKPAALAGSTATNPDKKPRWLTVSSPKGGSGKTTTVVNLAVFAAHAGLSVAILDTDLQESAKDWWDLRPDDAPKIHMVGKDLKDIKEAIRRVQEIPGLDLVVVDTPTAVEYLPDETAALLEISDLVLVPSTAGRPDVKSVMGWMAFLKSRKIRAAYVINRANSRATVPSRPKPVPTKMVRGKMVPDHSSREVEDDSPLMGTVTFRAAQRKLNKSGVLCPFPIRQLEDIQKTHEVGVGVLEMNRAKGVDDFEAVWDFVSNMLGL